MATCSKSLMLSLWRCMRSCTICARMTWTRIRSSDLKLRLSSWMIWRGRQSSAQRLSPRSFMKSKMKVSLNTCKQRWIWSFNAPASMPSSWRRTVVSPFKTYKKVSNRTQLLANLSTTTNERKRLPQMRIWQKIYALKQTSAMKWFSSCLKK